MGNLATIKLKLGVFFISKGPLKKIDCTIKTHTVNFFTHFSVLTSYFLSWPHFLFSVFINTSLFFYFLTYIYIKSFKTKNARFTLVSDFQVLHSFKHWSKIGIIILSLFFVCLRLVWDFFEINGQSCNLLRLPNLKLKSSMNFDIYYLIYNEVLSCFH